MFDFEHKANEKQTTQFWQRIWETLTNVFDF